MLFDLIIIILIITAIYLGYKFGTSSELYRLAKVFIGMSFAGSYAETLGWTLTKSGFLLANDKAVLILTGYLIVFAVYWIVINGLERLFVSLDLKNSKFNSYLGMVANAVQAILFLSFMAFMSTQLSFVKKGYKPYLVKHSFIYIHMDRLCRNFITADFVKEVTKDSLEGNINKIKVGAMLAQGK